MRGSRVLTDKTYERKLANAPKGRDANLIRKRNSAIIYRYYMYNTFATSTFDLIIQTISEEFYLAPRTVTTILTSHIDVLKTIKQEQPGMSSLSKKYPQFNWSIKTVTLK